MWAGYAIVEVKGGWPRYWTVDAVIPASSVRLLEQIIHSLLAWKHVNNSHAPRCVDKKFK